MLFIEQETQLVVYIYLSCLCALFEVRLTKKCVYEIGLWLVNVMTQTRDSQNKCVTVDTTWTFIFSFFHIGNIYYI